MKNFYLKFVILSFILLFVLSSLISCSAGFSPENMDVNNEGSGYFEDTENEQKNSSENKFETDRKIIYTSSLKIETREYDKSITALVNLIDEYGGFIQDSRVENQTQTSGNYSLRRATYTVRIPSDKRLDFLAASGDVGTIVLNETKGEDVTDQFFDSQARLEAYETQEERLLELLSEATDLSEILDIEDRLTSVRYEIESLSGTLSKLSSLISLSTVNIEILEVRELSEPAPETFGEEIAKTFKSSINALVTTLRYATLAIVAIMPFLSVLAVFVVILILFIRRTNKRKKKKSSTDL